MDTTQIKVWDPLVRFFHWTLVAAFATAYFTGGELEQVHVFAGYLILALILVRVLWGFVGSPHARFRNFVRPPGTVLAYLRDEIRQRAARHVGHNPAGGAMVVALLVMLTLSCVLGMTLYGAQGHGPLALLHDLTTRHTRHQIEEVHEFFANATVMLVFFHVAGVVLSSFLHRENLVRAMFTGMKRA